jgi:DNA polymerase
MQDTLHFDFETRSDLDLTAAGLDAYFSPRANPQILMAAYRLNDGPIRHWQQTDGRFPRELAEAIEDPQVIKWAFNAQFERTASRRVLKLRTPRRNWRCSAVLAYMQSFTGGLAEVGEQIGLPIEKQKQKDGRRLIRMFTMPQRITKNQPHLWRNWLTDPEDWRLFCDYNIQDVVTEESIEKRLIRYPIMEEEWRFYELDQLINDRGIPVDLDFVENVRWMSERRKDEMLAQMREITGVDNPNSVSQLLPWLQSQGYPFQDLRKESVQRALKQSRAFFECDPDASDDDAPDVMRVLRRRFWAARTSTKKAAKAKIVVGDDGNARFLFQFAGASRTQRFSGREIQSQNLTRTPKALDAEEDGGEKLSRITDYIRRGEYDGFDLLFDEPMEAFTGCMRGMFRAPPGKEFRVCDLSSIESVGLGYIARCERLLNVFRNGFDAYKDFGAMFYQKPYEEITRAERQVCKPPTLGCGYRLGPKGLLTYAENMGVDMTLDEAIRAVRVFREGYPEVPQFWYDCESAIRNVLRTKRPVTVGCVVFDWIKPYLVIRLPKGRNIYYYKPRLEKRLFTSDKTVRKRIRSEGEFIHGAPEGEWITVEEPETYTKTVFTYMGREQKTGRWTRIEGHGGVATENIDQALTRDILMVGMDRLHNDGFNIVGHAHDEIQCIEDIDDDYHTVERMRELMTAPIEWAPGFPLNAAGWSGPFYRK